MRRRGGVCLPSGKTEGDRVLGLLFPALFASPTGCGRGREHGRTSLADEEARRTGEGCALISVNNKAGGKSTGPGEEPLVPGRHGGDS